MAIRFPNWRILLSLSFALSLALAPAIAEARAGGSFSGGGRSTFSGMGSRGLRSYENNGAQPLSRSLAPEPSPGYGAPGLAPFYGGSFFQRHPFLTGLAGGALGAWLFGNGGFGIGHAFGTLFQILLIGFLIFLALRWMRGTRPGLARGGQGGGWPAAGGFGARSVGAAVAPAAARYRGRDIGVADADLNAFQQIHAAVQEAWSRGDLGRLRRLMTPEMLSYFSEELTRNASQGVQNIVSDVRLVKGDVTEAWEEGDLQYATALMRWSAVDYVARLGRQPNAPDYVVSGDLRRPSEAEEVWTFVRRRGGDWLLSAIQQV
ncbi:MAG: TIM44-like domain-containing protein [Alphaproteobacteria bacterium]|nr:TIM44-like domain-containing protein [Alphaproteobacteria bacterium]